MMINNAEAQTNSIEVIDKKGVWGVFDTRYKNHQLDTTWQVLILHHSFIVDSSCACWITAKVGDSVKTVGGFIYDNWAPACRRIKHAEYFVEVITPNGKKEYQFKK